MVWVPPRTAYPNDFFTASDWNTFIRDNMLETEVGKAEGGSTQTYITSAGLNQVLELNMDHRAVAVESSSESTSWDGLDDSTGPQLETVCNTKALVIFSNAMRNGDANGITFSSFTVQRISEDPEDATSPDEPAGDRIMHYRSPISNGQIRMGMGIVIDTEPGLNQFTMVYRVASGRGFFSDRNLIVMPL